MIYSGNSEINIKILYSHMQSHPIQVRVRQGQMTYTHTDVTILKKKKKTEQGGGGGC